MNIDPWHIFTSGFGQMSYAYTAMVTLLNMAMYLVIIINVGRARGKYKIQAPSIDGPEEFQRALRVQMNTLEQLALHLPILWIAALAMSDVFAAAFGIIWTVGRILYARGYYQKPKRRFKGFIIAMFINVILFIGAMAGTLASF